MSAYIYAPPIIMLIAVAGIIWGVRRIRRLTKENKQASRVGEQQMLASIGLVPPAWAEAKDEESSLVDPAAPQESKAPAGAPPTSPPSASKIPWTVPMIGKPPVPPPAPRKADGQPPA